MSKHKQVEEKDAFTRARFERACTLIYLDFQNAPELKDRRCVRKITAWDKIYFVQFYWGSPVFLTKQTYLSSASELASDVGLVREFADPYRLQNNKSQKTRQKHHADSRWSRDVHQKWLDDHELMVRLYLARKKYQDLGDSEDLAHVKASYDLLRIEPFSSPEIVKSAYYQQAKSFHPDYGGNTKNFLLLQEAYKIALENSVEVNVTLLLKS
ncbi:J domain-containing protein [Anabaena azotica]|uniref:J domain-containing protein n=1 Tax=Anabaena azotica FACHB-119 TaxID=947527 RepID=A0ABR8D6G3_9NOST|nr:J domain-containing protein [Anabaena azotica]MBD2502482.1 J domain-containing protein [Anabaena azotica FACHB-119]